MCGIWMQERWLSTYLMLYKKRFLFLHYDQFQNPNIIAKTATNVFLTIWMAHLKVTVTLPT